MKYRVLIKTSDEQLAPLPVQSRDLVWEDAVEAATFAEKQFAGFDNYLIEIRDEDDQVRWKSAFTTRDNERFRVLVNTDLEEGVLAPIHDGWLGWGAAIAHAKMAVSTFRDEGPGYVIEIRDEKGELRWGREFEIKEE